MSTPKSSTPKSGAPKSGGTLKVLQIIAGAAKREFSLDQFPDMLAHLDRIEHETAELRLWIQSAQRRYSDSEKARKDAERSLRKKDT